ncbi:hypothetical protein KA012_00055 [Candidatus Woesebacteria bacterium]|nr:hypothetical protein [Candidatus Woesebacteria bacterium]
MPKYLLFLSIAFLFPFLLASPVRAQGVAVNQQGDVIYLGTTTSTTTTTTTTATPTPTPVPVVGSTMMALPQGYFPNFRVMVTSLLQIALIASVILVLFQLVTAGLNWITSGGDKAKTESARGKIVAAIVGLVLVVASWALFLFILQLIGLEPGTIIPFGP